MVAWIWRNWGEGESEILSESGDNTAVLISQNVSISIGFSQSNFAPLKPDIT